MNKAIAVILDNFLLNLIIIQITANLAVRFNRRKPKPFTDVRFREAA
jgi:hypothetical protein